MAEEKRKRSKPGERHYVNNKEFCAELVVWLKTIEEPKRQWEALKQDNNAKLELLYKEETDRYLRRLDDSHNTDALLIEHKSTLKRIYKDNVIKTWYTSRPIIPDGIAEKILKICQRLAYKSNFRDYTYVQEMCCDAIENCIKYACKFNPEKSENPFSYFTQIANQAYVRRIKKEKLEFYTKVSIIQSSGVMNSEFGVQSQDTDNDFSNSYHSFLRKHYDVELPVLEVKERKRRKCKDDDTFTLGELFGADEDE